ncbi:hypothetical protein [Thermocrispum municipale]|uniref:hypothetical protein n=1 Tax=Thermocrispum municipale TaxID=37926 RepID=UPI00048E6EBE|nr:hypothetical protein [Thermocrispum municipale]
MSAHTVNLEQLADTLLAEAAESHAGRAARTIVTGSGQRATVIALREGAHMAEHDSPPAATLQILAGRARLHTASEEWTLSAGELVAIPPQRHGLDALTDVAALLTVALR